MVRSVTSERFTSRRLLLVADGAAALALCAVAVVALPERPSSPSLWLAVLAAVVGGSTVAWRRLAPFTATVVALVTTAVGHQLGRQPLVDVLPFAIVLDTYTASAVGIARGQWRRVGMLMAVSLATVVVLAASEPGFGPGVVVQAALPVTIAPTVAGAVMAWRRGVTQQLDLTRALLEDEQELRVALSLREERRRLARELHDVVAHAVIVMAIQAGAARVMLADGDPSGIRTRLERIAAAGRDALAELRRLVAAPDSPREPGAPGLPGLVDLVAHACQAGLETELVASGDVGPLDDDLAPVVSRVTQEALTNAVKYARGGRATVTLRQAAGALELRVVSVPPEVPPPVVRTDTGGRGLVSMGERVRAHGGVLLAGPGAGGSFEVVARIPAARDRRPPVEVGRRRRPALVASWDAWWDASWDASQAWRGNAAACLILLALELDVALSPQRRGPWWVNALVAAAMSVALVWRIRQPLTVCLVITALSIPLSGGLTDITQATLMSTFVFVVPVYSVAAWAGPRSASVGLVAVLSMILGVGLWHDVGWSELLANLVLTVALWAVGRLVRAQRRLAGSLETTCASLLAERARRQRATAEVERSRIVGDLEASLLHDVTAMVDLAESELEAPSTDQLTAIVSIEAVAGSALAAMREIVGVLRPYGDRSEAMPRTGPQISAQISAQITARMTARMTDRITPQEAGAG